LRPGVSVEQAEAELDVLSERYATANPNARNLDVGPLTLVQWKAALTARVDTMLWMLLAAVGFVLLIGCANVATLLMARATSRSRELAVRAALGATRGRLIGQLLTESVMLSVAGGLLGLLVARIALGIVAQVTVVELPRAEEIRLDGVVLGFTAALSIAAGAFFGTLPALQVLRPDLMDRLRQSGVSDPRPSSVRGTRVSARGLLVVVQVALSMVLLVGAGLMMQTLARLASVDLGFYPAGLLTMQLPLAEARYDTPEKRAAFFDEVVQRVDGLPGVRGVALVRTLPTTGGLATNLQVEGQEIAEPGHMGMVLQTITPGAFRVLGVPLRRGREFTARDEAPGAPPVVIINESLARRVWPTDPADSNPIGRRLNVPFLTVGPLEIVGVVADVRQGGPKRDAPPQFYIPTVLNPPQFAHLVVRGEHDPLLSVPAIRAEVLVIDRDQPLADVRMMDEMLDASIGQQHAAARLLALFAGTALLLALVGIYGVLAYSVAQRTQEIAIRRTFGATRDDILGLVLRQAMRLTLIGVVCGLVGAATFTRLMETLLFEVSSTDLTTFGGVAVLFVMVALVASVVPALRAVRIDPATGLRI
jgi:predicted permease